MGTFRENVCAELSPADVSMCIVGVLAAKRRQERKSLTLTVDKLTHQKLAAEDRLEEEIGQIVSQFPQTSIETPRKSMFVFKPVFAKT